MNISKRAPSLTTRYASSRPLRRLIKVLLLGDRAGREVLFDSLKAKLEGYHDVIGTNFAVERFNFNSFETIFQIWSISEGRRYVLVRPLFYSGALGSFIFFDMSNPESFAKVPQYVTEVIENNENRVVAIALMGYSSTSTDPLVSQEQIDELMDSLTKKLHRDVLYFNFAKFKREDVSNVCRSIMTDIAKLNDFNS
ncbi:MAG: hypothetical protein KAR35_07430 [Candidatus Heimdallarchaeota archaeon]|nr:hypothetical protein [Candidatus Heimdallarchaeota archaeon]MCK5049192.1 hypothetical protein [Candidatus Heimdallarchaeota archaeon]